MGGLSILVRTVISGFTGILKANYILFMEVKILIWIRLEQKFRKKKKA
jgi:hypothetical protein